MLSSDRRRPWLALGLGSAAALAVALALTPFHSGLPHAVPVVLLVLPVVLAALVGGRLPAIAVAVVGTLVLAWGFLPPIRSVRVSVGEDLAALAVFLVVAIVVGTLVATVAAANRARFAAEEARIAALVQLDHDRRALLRSVSHDLRTPLATIRAVATDLRAGTRYDPATRDELLDLVSAEAERLDRIVGNLLSLSRIEAGTFSPDLQAVDLAELAKATTDRLGRLLQHLDVELAIPDDLPPVLADYSQIDQVLTNLLENAARHSPPETPIVVSAALGDPGQIEMIVADAGPGFRGTEPEAGTTASGFGLVICRAIVEAHGGTLTVGDAAGGGARCCLTLPVAGATSRPHPDAAGAR